MFEFSIIFFIIAVVTTPFRSHKLWIHIINTLSLFLYLLMSIIYFSADFFTGVGVDESVIYTLQTGLGNAGFGDYILLIAGAVFASVVMFALTYLYYRLYKKSIPKKSKIKQNIHTLFIALALLTHPLIYNLYQLYSYRTIKASTDFDKYYHTPTIDKDKINKKNIVYIYAESLERTYFDKNIFPSLITELRDFQSKSIDFSNVEQVIGVGWTIGGIVASECGIPLFTPSDGNSMGGSDTFLQGAKCLGDTFKDLGYYTEYIQGASTKFSGKNKFFTTHKFDKILGRDELVSTLEDKFYLNAWGLYDDSTFDIALKEYKSLKNKNRPFALFIMTLDTHHPDGHLSKTCKDLGIRYKDGSNPILNAVKCSDYLIAKFIKEIIKDKNTVIVVASDHLAMKNSASMLLEKANRRGLFLLYSIQNKHKVIPKKATTLDIAPTLLYQLDIDTDYGLGRNLFKRDSLITYFGQNYDNKLYSWRDNILGFWNFPKLEGNYTVDIKERYMSIGTHRYKIPVILEIRDDNLTLPHFSFDSDLLLEEAFLNMPDNVKFVWIDNCQDMVSIFDVNITKSGYCISQGRVSGNFNIQKLQDKIDIKSDFRGTFLYNKKEMNIRIKDKKEKLLYKIKEENRLKNIRYKASLKDGIKFYKYGYPTFIYAVFGISGREKWGRWSDANLAPEVKFEFKDKLPKDFVLELKIQAYKDNLNKNLIIKVGDVTKIVKITSNSPKLYKIKFNGVDSNSIIVIPPNPMQPNTKDSRKIAIGFVELKVVKTGE